MGPVENSIYLTISFFRKPPWKYNTSWNKSGDTKPLFGSWNGFQKAQLLAYLNTDELTLLVLGDEELSNWLY